MDRKYSHRGYRDAENNEKKDKYHKAQSRSRPPSGGPRADQFGPRTPRMVGTVTRARCSNCGAVLTSRLRSQRQMPQMRVSSLHCCKQCRFFDSAAQFECTQPIPERITPKDAKNDCKFYEFRTTVEKDTAPTSYAQKAPAANATPPPSRHNDARQAFEDLFKK